jgi:hypothetical protein
LPRGPRLINSYIAQGKSIHQFTQTDRSSVWLKLLSLFIEGKSFMSGKSTTSTRAPRGAKTLTQAFFNAADGIPDAQRADVVKAALTAIRNQLKEVKDKAKIAKMKAKEKAAKVATAKAPKATVALSKKPTPSAPKSAKVIAAKKPAVTKAKDQAPVPEASVESAVE